MKLLKSISELEFLDRKLKMFLIWSFICGINSVIGFSFAYGSYDLAAMILVVSLFAIGFTFFSFTNKYESIRKNKVLFRSMWIGYILNAFLFHLHFFIGLSSLAAVEVIGFNNEKEFAATFLTTIIMGFLLNIAAFLFISAIYYCQVLYFVISNRLFRKNQNSIY